MAILRLEKSNTTFSPEHTSFYTLYSSHIGGRRDISVYNDDANGIDLPIIVLMHGVYGSHWAWMYSGGAHKVYEQLRQKIGEFVLVMPSDGGYRDGSAYLPISHEADYDKWIMDDVLSGVIENTQCISHQSKVYLTGLSMGGYGALRLGAKYAEQISGISAHSSVTSLKDLAEFTDVPDDAYTCANPKESDILYWLVKHQNRLPPIRMDCGKEDSLFNSNVRLSEQMNDHDIPHQFEHYHGDHNWDYWYKYIAKTFYFFNELHYIDKGKSTKAHQ